MNNSELNRGEELQRNYP